MAKPKLALYWSAACGGCDVAILDTNEKILDIANLFDIVFWPIAVDFKYHHIRAIEDKSIDLCLFNGAIRSTEQEEIAKLFREKSKVMVAFGACACFGGIPALANFTSRDEILQTVYLEAPSNSNEQKTVPLLRTKVAEGELELPELFDTVLTLEQVVPVEYFVPGCPPPVDLILKLVDLFASGKMPPVGAMIASDKTCCDECDRIKEEKKITRFYRPHEIITDPKKCLLDQGIICCGPATRGGCGMRCVKANMPCRGCFGPPPGVVDQGTKLVSSIASIFQGDGTEAINKMVEEIVDPAGTFYRFGMADSMLKRKRLQKS
ncbi:MAG: oxidoreductase [Chloroflexi bacterium RBG_13_52_12]|nr:MAG: oxidoreductase [Chloroflexi bacterium RBG_13_52_12]